MTDRAATATRWNEAASALRLRAALVLAVAATALGAASATGGPNDPYFHSTGSWGQAHADQWALHRVGFADGEEGSAWAVADGSSSEVVVAVVDTGLDYFHPDLARSTVWRNPAEEANGKDDDGNGYVDDLIGWNFYDDTNDPWDYSGHGTHVSGIVAARTGNGEGIAGVSRGARIMPLKVMNFVGRGRSVGIAEAIFYAVEEGARVINLSLGSRHISRIEAFAIDYARERGAVVVVAAGNEASDVRDFGPAGLAAPLTVGASNPGDERAAFSNWGDAVDLVAPGVDVLSLRARRTDFARIAGLEDYAPGEGFAGSEDRYYRATGTSFAAPFVTGVAALLFAKDPELRASEVERMIRQSARDLETPGVDRWTGYGLLDARAALEADPSFFLEAGVAGVRVARDEEGTRVLVQGVADADALERAWVELGPGEAPETFVRASEPIEEPVRDGLVGAIDASKLRGRPLWTVRLVVEHESGRRREARYRLQLGGG